MKAIKFVDLAAKNKPYCKSFLKRAKRILLSGEYILGQNVKIFEKALQKILKAKYFVSCANGTDALILSLKSCGIKPGDEVLVTPMSYLASVSCVKIVGATPIFCDVDNHCNIDPVSIKNKITKKTKALILVHLGGIPARIDEILKIIKKHSSIYIIEDCAQAFGSTVNGRFVGTFGDFGCFSFHPLKTFGALGDGGGIVVKAKRNYNYLLKARNHGHINRNDCSFFSQNSRLDEIQAAFLSLSIKKIFQVIKKRKYQVHLYLKYLNNLIKSKKIIPILPDKKNESSFNFFMIMTKNRNKLKKYLFSQEIDCRIHYPILLNHLKAFKGAGKDFFLPNAEKNVRKILSLPLGPHLGLDHIKKIALKIEKFFRI